MKEFEPSPDFVARVIVLVAVDMGKYEILHEASFQII